MHDDFMKNLDEFRSGLRPGGPDVDYPVLIAYVDGEPVLSQELRASVEKHIVTWENWFHAYWETVGDLTREDLDAQTQSDEAEFDSPAEWTSTVEIRFESDALAIGHRTTSTGASGRLWVIESLTRDSALRLPPEVASVCYGTQEQEIHLVIRQTDSMSQPEKYDLELEVRPAPQLQPMVITLSFFDGLTKSFTVMRPRGNSPSAVSLRSEPIERSSLNPDGWRSTISFGTANTEMA